MKPMRPDSDPRHAGRATAAPEAEAQARRLATHCARYRGGDTLRSMVQLATTGILFLLSWSVMVAAAGRATWLTLALALPTAGLLVRLFIMQHDCGHGSFFPTRQANDRLGRLLGIVTLTPYGFWRREHALHHATSGDLSRPRIGTVDLLTAREYAALPWYRRLAYRLYRNPLVLVLVGGPLYFLARNRLPLDCPLPLKETWASVMSLNAVLALVYAPLMIAAGSAHFLAASLAFFLPAWWVGVWMFLVQHQYEGARWFEGETWEFHTSAMLGSSHYCLPRALGWFTGHIGIHHVHHLCPRIPNYRLQECLEASPELKAMNRLTIAASLKSARLVLWDEEARRLISFRDLASRSIQTGSAERAQVDRFQFQPSSTSTHEAQCRHTGGSRYPGADSRLR